MGSFPNQVYAKHEQHQPSEQTKLFPSILALSQVITAAANVSYAATLRSLHAVGNVTLISIITQYSENVTTASKLLRCLRVPELH